jgi:glycosyltransferase involved in cell wall biosynthesis
MQRDTEGKDLISPKLEKGPDILCDEIERRFASNPNVEVVLAGWRRQYVMNRLKSACIKFHYFELPSQEIVRKLYSTLDLYIVSARYEGGPQSIVECAAMKVPIISTDVGLAGEILSPASFGNVCDIHKLQSDVEFARRNVEGLFIPKGFIKFMNIFDVALQATK